MLYFGHKKLDLMLDILRLNYHSFACLGLDISISINRVWIHITFVVVFPTALYSASVLERETIGCLQALYETRLVPKKTA
jgi:hypothetical protein